MADDTTDMVLAVAHSIGRNVREQIADELKRKAIGLDLQRLLFFGALSQLVVEVFAVAPTVNKPSPDERRRLFEEFLQVTRDDFEATLKHLGASPDV